MGPVPLWKVCHIMVTWCAGGSVATLSLGETGTLGTAAVGVGAGVGLAVACGVGAAVGAGAAVAVAVGVAAGAGALVAAVVGAGVAGAIVGVGAAIVGVGAGVDGAIVAGAGVGAGASVASSSPQAKMSRAKTISAPTREYTRHCSDHCIFFMLLCLLHLRVNPVTKLHPGGWFCWLVS